MSIRDKDFLAQVGELQKKHFHEWVEKYFAPECRKIFVEPLNEIRDRVEELESYRGMPGKTLRNSEASEHAQKFLDWIRRPHDHSVKAILAEAESAIMKKAVTIG